MSTVKIDASNPENFQQKSFKLMPKAHYLMEVAKPLVVSAAKSSSNHVVNVELRCMDEGEFRGSAVFDTITLTSKAEFKLVHLALACGTQTKDEITANGVDLDLLTSRVCKCAIDVQGPRTNPSTGQEYSEKNVVKAYLFTPDS